METTTYELIIPLSELDEVNMLIEETSKFSASNPGVRINSIGHQEVSRNESEITFNITIEFE